MLKDYIFTSESVTEGHPDKMADQVSDAVLDALLEQDPHSRVACETMISSDMMILAGEVSSLAQVDFPGVVKERVGEIYHPRSRDVRSFADKIQMSLNEQSPDIAQGVNDGEGRYKEQGAGDQGLMFGYAVDETENLMPLTIDLAHKLAFKLSQVRKEGILPFLRPDGKTQVSAQYEGGRLKRLSTLVISSQHAEEVSLKQVEEGIREEVIAKIVAPELMDEKTQVFINPTGRFVIGGPQGDCGLTGRKIIVDTYGGHGAHGGGAFSGKDPSKVDRSAAYAARQVAKHIVAAQLAEKSLVQVAYAIGVARPVSFLVDTFGTEKVDLDKINHCINKVFDMRPRSIIERLDLLRPIYTETAAYGHFGRESAAGFTWEKLDRMDEIKSYF